MRRLLLGAVVVMVTAALAVPAAQAGPSQRAGGSSRQQATSSAAGEYLVLAAKGASAAAVQTAVAAAGGTVVSRNSTVGLVRVRTANPNFLGAVTGQRAVFSAMANAPIGSLPKDSLKPDKVEADRVVSETAKALAAAGSSAGGAPGAEPLSDKQWDMRQIDATPNGSYRVNQGSRQVLVGIIDSGIDGNHPDLRDNFNRRLSRNFVTDIPSIDGACEHPSCVDPVDEDDNGHGSHVSGIVAAELNGLGTAGVAPKVSLVNIRGGQDSGFVFLQPVVDALTYAGTVGIDVVNMSFFIDPWLFNCLNNPADTPAQQLEQRTVREATQRAVDFARAHGVLPVAALGNQATDLDHPTTDNTSPDFPAGAAHPRTIDNSCISVPVETDGVVSVSALGPSGRKAFYSNWGPDQADVAAPGGDSREGFGTTRFNIPENRVLSTMPLNVAQANNLLNPDGTPNTPLVLRDCKGSTCAYYQYLQGTSMASPHAAGVAALIVSKFGHRDRQHGGLTLNPATTERILRDTATKTPCPVPALFDYPEPNSVDALCEGTLQHNGFYGDGIVNALTASLR
jgi:lantibiotic leader peptide-processing serine protease